MLGGERNSGAVEPPVTDRGEGDWPENVVGKMCSGHFDMGLFSKA